MKLTRTSEIRGDETASYIVEEYKATTLGEFVEEVLKERPRQSLHPKGWSLSKGD